VKFPNTFTWGAGTSAFQIEGAATCDDKGLSVWDVFAQGQRNVQGNEDGTVACDHYHRYLEDVQLMREIGLGAYRFSVSWPRVLPDGTGRINPQGIGFYDRLVDKLLQANIDPWVTLYHWDYPTALMDRNGWLSDDSPKWFGEFVLTVHDRLGDRVRHWITLNEPNIFVPFGFQRGLHAPGLHLPEKELVRITHNLLKSHAVGAGILHRSGNGKNRVGCALSMSPWEPDPSSADENRVREIANRKTFELSSSNPFKSLILWSHPLIKGEYPESYRQRFEVHLEQLGCEAIPGLVDSIDFCALNIYASAGLISVNAEGQLREHKYAQCEHTPKTLFHWPVTPRALYWGPYWMYQEYGLPVVVTENGMSAHDWVQLDGQVHDSHRIDFTRRYLVELQRVIHDKVPVEGYFHWSLMDNFEWAEGYRQRFGLVHVDRLTLDRTVKDSGIWYRQLAHSNAIPPPATLACGR
jgi:beta-glucosidase